MLIFPYTHFITPDEKWLGSKQSKPNTLKEVHSYNFVQWSLVLIAFKMQEFPTVQMQQLVSSENMPFQTAWVFTTRVHENLLSQAFFHRNRAVGLHIIPEKSLTVTWVPT